MVRARRDVGTASVAGSCANAPDMTPRFGGGSRLWEDLDRNPQRVRNRFDVRAAERCRSCSLCVTGAAARGSRAMTPLRTRRPKSVAAHSSGPGLTSTGPGTVTAMVCHAIRPVIQDSGQQDHGNRDLNQYSGGRPDRPDCGRGAHVSQVLARERTVAVEANPRAISQMANVSSNNPPGMAATSAAPATPNSSSRLPAAKHA